MQLSFSNLFNSTRRRSIVATLALGAAITLPAAAQNSTGELDGTVRDSSGAVVPGAKVIITNIDRGAVERTVPTNKAGDYTAPLLPVGHYTVTVEAPNFKKITEDGIILNVNDKRIVNASLQVGSVAETVTVQANALAVNT